MWCGVQVKMETLRQHDFRETASCPPAGSSHQECRNILLDLHLGAKNSLVDPPKQYLALKSCDISSTRPHLLLVRGSDAFARLYDRRMLPPLSSSQKKLPPPRCVDYFCPMHLSNFGSSSLRLTHITFSPNGEEVLLSYSREHVYLMDANLAFGSTMRYTSTDVSRATRFSPIYNGVELKPSISGVSLNGFPVGNKAAAVEVNPDCRKIIKRRKWKGDAHMAIRDCNGARRIYPSSAKALICMAEALSMLEKHKETLDFAIAAQSISPSDFEVMERVENIKKKIAAAEVENAKAESARRILSLSDIIYHSEANNDASVDDLEREDSDYDEEIEVDIEPSVSGGRFEPDFGFDPRNLDLRIHRLVREIGKPKISSGPPILSSKNDEVPHQPEGAIDMKQIYVGHCNIGTDINQASFIGQRGEYIASGSDDGRWFIWDKKTGRLLKMLHGDEAVVTCVQCHPRDCVIPTSGIDSTIKIWTPCAPVPSLVAGGAAGPEISDVLEAMEGNQRRLCRIHEDIGPFEILEQFRMHELAEGNLHPFEYAQS